MMDLILVNPGLHVENAMRADGGIGCLTTVRSPVDIVTDDNNFVIILSFLYLIFLFEL